jgi:hypothetical protein
MSKILIMETTIVFRPDYLKDLDDHFFRDRSFCSTAHFRWMKNCGISYDMYLTIGNKNLLKYAELASKRNIRVFDFSGWSWCTHWFFDYTPVQIEDLRELVIF